MPLRMRCFDAFGVDWMISEQENGELEPFILEINRGPDLYVRRK
jgi:hypothetical protein